MTKLKKIKVQITDEVSTYTTDGETYLPGDTVMVDEASFVSDFMVKVEKQTKKPEPSVETTSLHDLTTDEIPHNPIPTATTSETEKVVKKPTRKPRRVRTI